MNAGPFPAAWRFDRFTLDFARSALLGPDGGEISLRPVRAYRVRLDGSAGRLRVPRPRWWRERQVLCAAAALFAYETYLLGTVLASFTSNGAKEALRLPHNSVSADPQLARA